MLPNDRAHAIPADIGEIIEPKPVIDKVVEVDVAPMITIVSTDSRIVLMVYNFCISFLIYVWFFSLTYVIISLMLLIWL